MRGAERPPRASRPFHVNSSPEVDIERQQFDGIGAEQNASRRTLDGPAIASSRCMRGALVGVMVPVLIAGTSGVARAEGWYGWQTYSADALAAVLILDSGHDESAGILGVGLYAFGAPLIHWAHGDGGRAGVSLGARLVAPVIGLVAATENDGEDDDVLGGIIAAGVVAGFVALVDGALASEEDDGAPARMFKLGGTF